MIKKFIKRIFWDDIFDDEVYTPIIIRIIIWSIHIIMYLVLIFMFGFIVYLAIFIIKDPYMKTPVKGLMLFLIVALFLNVFFQGEA